MRDEDIIIELAYGAGIKGTIFAVLDAAFSSKKILGIIDDSCLCFVQLRMALRWVKCEKNQLSL